MSQWESLQQLDPVHLLQVDELYSKNQFPMEVRHYLAHWIENQSWDKAIENESVATVLFQNFLENLDIQYSRFANDKDTFVQQHNLRKFKHNLQADYQDAPTRLAFLVTKLLRDEKKILTSVLNAQQCQMLLPQVTSFKTVRQQDIEKLIEKLKVFVQEVDLDVRFLEEHQDEFDFRYKTQRCQENSVQQNEQKILQCMLNDLDKNRKNVLVKFNELMQKSEILLNLLVCEELSEWKVRQQKACIGAPLDTNLTEMENWFTAFAESLFLIKRLLKKLSELCMKVTYGKDPFKSQQPLLEGKTEELLSMLLKSAFVVEHQPSMAKRPLVLRTSLQFSVRVRLLVRLPDQNIFMKVVVAIDKNPPKGKGYRKFNILGTASKALAVDEFRNEGLIADFKHLTLREQKAGTGGKGNNDVSLIVTEELHIFSFDAVLEYQGLSINLETSSLPVVIISNVSQLSSAWGSILWYNMMCTDLKDVTFFSNPPAAPWKQLADVLSWQFLSSAQQELNEDQLSMLAEKLFGAMENYADSSLSWTKFIKENMPSRGFSFWTWIDGILTLIKNYIEDIWKAGYIIGFVSKEKEKAMLKDKMMGTFLLRFSESSKDGGITFSWVEHLPNGKSLVRSVQPYTKNDLQCIRLVEILRNYQLLAEENIPENPLKYLYPNIPKDEAFGKFYEDKDDGSAAVKKYLKTRLIMVSERCPSESSEPVELPDDLMEFGDELLGCDPVMTESESIMEITELMSSLPHGLSSSTGESFGLLFPDDIVTDF
ncbi:signal transducer and activator of transcription 3-like isoform X1 [Protopterus annectens]|uniref:signal transducer and activator of transcription 3-like isoform X1 n=1 Tax=Protopterus annectens TaxID=7888 RepID=UPI001CFBC631|nr:signal transducer and activator of transcription 3-like isoform X1 [Protopterus annectens]XP_043939606.1 signal transducer and activator of transcription 3-like isoform X1 [Protopterus annectens]